MNSTNPADEETQRLHYQRLIADKGGAIDAVVQDNFWLVDREARARCSAIATRRQREQQVADLAAAAHLGLVRAVHALARLGRNGKPKPFENIGGYLVTAIRNSFADEIDDSQLIGPCARTVQNDRKRKLDGLMSGVIMGQLVDLSKRDYLSMKQVSRANMMIDLLRAWHGRFGLSVEQGKIVGAADALVLLAERRAEQDKLSSTLSESQFKFEISRLPERQRGYRVSTSSNRETIGLARAIDDGDVLADILDGCKTDREKDIVRLYAAGNNGSEVAKLLGVANSTVTRAFERIRGAIEAEHVTAA